MKKYLPPFSKGKIGIAALFALLLLMIATNIFAATTPGSIDDQRLLSIAKRMIAGQSVTAQQKAEAYSTFLRLQQDQQGQQPPSTMLTGGPDAFGYRFEDQATNASLYSWVTLDGSATLLAGNVYTDDGFTIFNIPFNFNFYGTDYTQGYAGSNGYITFGAGSTAYSGLAFNSATPPAAIGWYMRDNHGGYGGTSVRVETFGVAPNRYCVVEYDDICQYGSAAINVNLQVIMYETSDMKIQYSTVNGAWSGGLIGIKNATGSINLPYTGTMSAGNAIHYYKLGQATNPIPANAATGIPTNVILSWNAAANATGYDVYLNTFTPPTTLVSSNQAGISYTPVGLTPTTLYYWQIVSRNSLTTNPGPIWSFTTSSGPAPNAPSGGSVTGATTTSLTMNWSDNSSDETGFPITSSTDGSTFSPLTTTATNATSYNNIGLGINTQHWYNVYAINGGGTSSGFASANGWTLASVPAAPIIGAIGPSTAQITPQNSALVNPPSTQYAILVDAQYVQANGTLGGSAVWQTLATWGTIGVTGLAPTTHAATVVARNGANVATAVSTAANFTNNIPWISFSLPSISFANVVAGVTANVVVQVQNIGSQPLHVTNITATTVVPGATSMTVAPGTSTPLNIAWYPPSIGANLADVLHFTSDASNGPTNNLNVTGNAIGLLLTLPNNTVIRGNQAIVPITIGNTTNLNILSFQLSFNFAQSALTYNSISQVGTITAGWSGAVFAYSSPTGNLQISGASATPLTGSGTLVNVIFDMPLAGTGNSQLNWNNASCMMNEGTPLLTFTNGFLTINNPNVLTFNPNISELFEGDSVLVSVSGGTPPYTLTTTLPLISHFNQTGTSSGYFRALHPGVCQVHAVDNALVTGNSGNFTIHGEKLSIRDTSYVSGTTVLLPVRLQLSQADSLGPPDSLSIKIVQTFPVLKWKQVTGAHYNVYRRGGRAYYFTNSIGVTPFIDVADELPADPAYFQWTDLGTYAIDSSRFYYVTAFAANGAPKIYSGQFTLTWNQTFMSLIGVQQAGTLTATWSLSYDNSHPGTAGLSFSNSVPFPDGGGTLLYLQFTMSNSGGTSPITFTNQLMNETEIPVVKNATISQIATPTINVNPSGATETVVGDSVQCSASGGTAPYNWSLTTPATGSIVSTGPTIAKFYPTAGGQTYAVATDAGSFSGQSGLITVDDFSLIVQSLSAHPGDSATVNILLQGTVTGLGVLSSDMTFGSDATIQFAYTNVTGTLMNGWLAAFNSTGNNIHFTSASATPLTGTNGTMLQLRLRIMPSAGLGIHNITITSATLNEGNRRAFRVNGTINVIP